MTEQRLPNPREPLSITVLVEAGIECVEILAVQPVLSNAQALTEAYTYK